MDTRGADEVLTKADLLSPSEQDKNAGNSGDLIKHASYLALLREIARGRAPGAPLHVIEAHGGKGVYLSGHPHLLEAQRLPGYASSTLGKAQAGCFAPTPVGLGDVRGLQVGEITYAGSAVLHAREVVGGVSSRLTLLDKDPGVRNVVARVFSEPCFSGALAQLAIQDPGGPSEPVVLSRLQGGAFGSGDILHCDPFAFVMAPKHSSTRSLYQDLIRECDARVHRGALAAASVFFTWGSNGAAAKDDLDGAGYGGGMPGGYQALVSAVSAGQRLVVNWCWELFFSLVLILPGNSKAAITRAIEVDTAWLRPAMRRLQIV